MTECKLFIGPMFSGKTTELIRCVKRESIAEIKCLIVKYSNDTRYGKELALFTHSGMSLKEKKYIRVVKAKKLSEIKLEENEEVIAIDEGQFYEDLPEAVEKWMRRGKKVYISALDGDYLRKPFGKIQNIIPLCTHVVKLRAVCMSCKKKDASYTKRKSSVRSKKIELIGSDDKYMAVCFECY